MNHYMKIIVGAWIGFCLWVFLSIIGYGLFPELIATESLFWLMAVLFSSIGGLIVFIRMEIKDEFYGGM